MLSGKLDYQLLRKIVYCGLALLTLFYVSVLGYIAIFISMNFIGEKALVLMAILLCGSLAPLFCLFCAGRSGRYIKSLVGSVLAFYCMLLPLLGIFFYTEAELWRTMAIFPVPFAAAWLYALFMDLVNLRSPYNWLKHISVCLGFGLALSLPVSILKPDFGWLSADHSLILLLVIVERIFIMIIGLLVQGVRTVSLP